MRNLNRATSGLILLGLFAASQPLFADDDVEGEITSIDSPARTFVVNGLTIHTDERTDYDDELQAFADLKVGDRVEVDFVETDGRAVAREIERDD